MLEAEGREERQTVNLDSCEGRQKEKGIAFEVRSGESRQARGFGSISEEEVEVGRGKRVQKRKQGAADTTQWVRTLPANPESNPQDLHAGDAENRG